MFGYKLQMPQILSLLCLILASTHTKDDYMALQFAVGLSFLSIFLSYHIARKLGWLAGVTAAYTAIYCIAVMLYLHGKYPVTIDMQMRNALAVNSGFCLCILLLMVIPLLEAPKSWLANIRCILGPYTVTNALLVLFNWKMGLKLGNSNGVQGFLDYSGMNACLMGVGCAFLLPNEKSPYKEIPKFTGLCLTIWAIWLSKSALSFGVLGVVIATRFFNPIPAFLAMGMGVAAVGTKMLTSSFRFTAYKLFLKELYHQGKWVFGTGPGTFRVLSAQIQINHNFMIDMKTQTGWLWLWMHSDFLQALFEGGIIYFVLCVGLYTECMVRMYKNQDREFLSFGMGLGVMGALNYPCRYFPTAFLCAYFLVVALLREEASEVGTMDLKASLPEPFEKFSPSVV